MKGKATYIKDPESGNTKNFAFDFSYWSHDQYNEEADGYLRPADSKYDDQV